MNVLKILVYQFGTKVEYLTLVFYFMKQLNFIVTIPRIVLGGF